MVQSAILSKYKDKLRQSVFKACKKLFSRSHKFNKIFNLNTIKISYRSMPNVKNLIKQNNLKIMTKYQTKLQRSCNCRIRKSCPLNGKCLRQCMVCKAEVTTNITYKEYYGTSEGESEPRCNNHAQSFRHISHIDDTELFPLGVKSKWDLLPSKMEYKIVRIPI